MTERTSAYRERNSTADRVLDILLMFDDQHLRVSATEVARQLDVARSTAYRYLQSLVGSDFVEEAEGGGFRLGRRVIELARLAQRGMGLSDVARPIMKRLAADAGEAVLLTRLAGTAVVCLEREDVARHAIRISYERGQVLPTNAGASAYVLLAWRPDDEVGTVLAATRFEAFTERTITNRRDMVRRLRETREQGYAVSYGELDRDVLGIAAPIRGGAAADAEVVAAISVAAVGARVPQERIPVLADSVRAAAAEISSRIAPLD